MNNLQLIENIRNGDLKTFEQVFRDHYDELCNFAMRYTKDFDLAEEAVQDVFCRIWNKHTELAINSSLIAYLFQAVKNQCFQHFKHKTVELKYAEMVKQDTESYSINPAEEIEVVEITAKIEETLQSLPERCRDIFILSRYEGLKYQQIADKLAISVKTVEANMGKALKTFRDSLGNYLGN